MRCEGGEGRGEGGEVEERVKEEEKERCGEGREITRMGKDEKHKEE